MTPTETIRFALQIGFGGGDLDRVEPAHWARTFGCDRLEIERLIAEIRADRTTRAAPNAHEEGFEAAE